MSLCLTVQDRRGVTAGSGVAFGALATIFGTNLAASTAMANTIPLPLELAGTSVIIRGERQRLLYVSPGKINFQVGAIAWSGHATVQTAAGVSDGYPMFEVSESLGIFTIDGTGCGPGAVLNVRADGSVSVNSRLNSASPGEVISVFGTGLSVLRDERLLGIPAPAEHVAFLAELRSEFNTLPSAVSLWSGTAPGLIGVDQFNYRLPESFREGCAIPIQVAGHSLSQPVTISVHRGGGACVDPPQQGYGEINWVKTTTYGGTVRQSENVSVSFQSSPGKALPSLTQPFNAWTNYLSSACPIDGYRSLEAGAITVQADGRDAMEAPMAPAPGLVAGLEEHRAELGPGSIHERVELSVRASGGPDVPAFSASVVPGAEIQITTPIAGRSFKDNQPIVVEWTGGDANSYVKLSMVWHFRSSDEVRTDGANAAKGRAALSPVAAAPWASGPIDLIVEVMPDPAKVPVIEVPGLSLGIRHLWKYVYRFEGVTLN